MHAIMTPGLQVS